MNEAYANAVITALEGQRNNALNGLVKAEAALTVATNRIGELEVKLAASAQVVEVNPA